jgi:hypothetical protein
MLLVDDVQKLSGKPGDKENNCIFNTTGAELLI